MTLLADSDLAARTGAVRAIADSGPGRVLLLRLKTLLGDKEIEVTGECFAALLSLDPAGSVDFVANFLRSRMEGIGEQAALALGESRLPAAIEVLREAWGAGWRSGAAENTAGCDRDVEGATMRWSFC